MPVFCDVSAEEQIEALREHFKSKGAKLNEQIPVSADKINENLSDLIKNIECCLALSPQALETSELDELEMVLNSLVSLIILSPDDNSKLVSLFCESILKAVNPAGAAAAQSGPVQFGVAVATNRYGLIKLRVLSNLYHGLVSTSKHRYTVFLNLAKCSLTEKSLQYLSTDLDSIKHQLQVWNSSLEETQALYRALFDTLSQLNESQKALKILNELLGTYNKANASKAREDALKYHTFTKSSSHNVSSSFILLSQMHRLLY